VEEALAFDGRAPLKKRAAPAISRHPDKVNQTQWKSNWKAWLLLAWIKSGLLE
jgi:hypothetical protein